MISTKLLSALAIASFMTGCASLPTQQADIQGRSGGSRTNVNAAQTNAVGNVTVTTTTTQSNAATQNNSGNANSAISQSNSATTIFSLNQQNGINIDSNQEQQTVDVRITQQRKSKRY